MENLSLNINVSKAKVMLGTVSSATCVDRYLLLDDEGFIALIHKYSHQSTIDEGISALIEYVNENY